MLNRSEVCIKRVNALLLIVLSFLSLILCVQEAKASNEFSNQKKTKVINVKKNPFTIIDFKEKNNTDRWRITNDGVMGGESQGRFLFENNKGVFAGDISLDNNGGFSSVFRTLESLPKNLETVTLDVEGDGLTYQLRMIVSLNGYRLAYKHNFNTVIGKRETLTFKFADFQASFRGRVITSAPVLQSQDIRQVGFLVTRKTAGKFSLSVFSLQF